MLSACTPQREICAQLHIGRGVLNRYKKLADEAKIDYSAYSGAYPFTFRQSIRA